MYCGLNIRAYGGKDTLDLLRNDEKFHFEESGNGCYKTPDGKKYRGFIIELNYKLGYAEMRGSIHKFKNYGMHNYNTFTVSDFLHTIKEFEEIFHLDKFNQKYLRNIEFGVNVRLGFNPVIVLESIIPYSGTGAFSSELGSKYSEIRVKHENYYDTILYNKSNQVSINKKHSSECKERHVLRLEVKTYGMRLLQHLASKTSLKKITKMSDLVHPGLLDVLRTKLVEEFNKLFIVDRELLDVQALSVKEKRLYDNAWKMSYWEQFEYKKNDLDKRAIKRVSKRKQRVLKDLKAIISQNNDLKNNIGNRLMKSLVEVIDTENVAISSIWNSPRSEVFTWKKDGHELYGKRLLSRFPIDEKLPGSIELIDSSILVDKKKDSNMSENPYLDKLGICDKELKRYTCCPITGLPLFAEDVESKYLSRKQILFYYENYPDVYPLLLRLISPEYRNISIESQIKKIAQAIRNRATYKRTKREKRCDPRQGVLHFLE